jgi:hypothetical protein
LLSPCSKIKFFKVTALMLIVSCPLNWHANQDDIFLPKISWSSVRPKNVSPIFM